MTPQDLIAAFETLADAPDGTTRLRELVLQLAVRGKLVPQDASDEPAQTMVSVNVQNLDRLVADKQVKRTKTYDYSLLPAPQYLPAGWSTERLSRLFVLKTGATPSRSNSSYFGGDIRWLVSGDIHQGRIVECEGRITKAGVESSNCKFLKPGSVLMALNGQGKTRGTVALLDVEATCNQSLVAIEPIGRSAISSDFLFWYLRGNYRRIRDITGQKDRRGLNMKIIASFEVPIPPLAEQHRIVAKVDALMGLLDRLEAARDARDTTRASLRDAALAALSDAEDTASVGAAWTRIAEHMDDLFTDPADVAPLRQTILQLAVRGRLVPQDASDEPAGVLLERIAAEKARLVKEKKIRKPKVLPPIEPDEVPFEVPEGWEWCRLGTMIRCVQGLQVPRPQQSDVQRKGMVRFLRISDFTKGTAPRFIDDPGPGYACTTEEILMVRYGDSGRVVSGLNGIFANNLFKIEPDYLALRVDFLALFLKSPFARTQLMAGVQSVALAQINHKKVYGLQSPLPPLAEQHRIVAKVDALMALCDDLEARLTAARTTRGAFAAAAVHHLDAA